MEEGSAGEEEGKWHGGKRGGRKEEDQGDEQPRSSHQQKSGHPTLPTGTLLHKQDFPQTDAGDQGSQTQILQGPGTYAGERSKTV